MKIKIKLVSLDKYFICKGFSELKLGRSLCYLLLFLVKPVLSWSCFFLTQNTYKNMLNTNVGFKCFLNVWQMILVGRAD